MTKDEILNMKASREMDVKIAEMLDLDPKKDSLGIWHIEDGGIEWRQMPFYSLTISAAWEVVEKYTDAVIEKVGDHYCVNLMVESVCAETAPLAICRAALLAVMK